MVGPILAMLALAVFCVPFVLMLYFAVRYVAGMLPDGLLPRRSPERKRTVRPDQPPRGGSGRLPCGHFPGSHQHAPCDENAPGWRWERVRRDDDWATGWDDERRWHGGR